MYTSIYGILPSNDYVEDGNKVEDTEHNHPAGQCTKVCCEDVVRTEHIHGDHRIHSTRPVGSQTSGSIADADAISISISISIFIPVMVTGFRPSTDFFMTRIGGFDV